MLNRRLEDRIRELCRKALAAQDAGLDAILSELRFALQEHAQRLRNVAAAKLVGKESSSPPERRSAYGSSD